MKILYAYLLGCLFLGGFGALGQDQVNAPDVPATLNTKAAKPFLGIALNIPLWKVFGKKKVKALPEQPKARLTEALDSTLNLSDLAELTSVDTLKASLTVSGPNLRKSKFNRQDQIPPLGGRTLRYVGSVSGEEVVGQDFYTPYDNPGEYNISPTRRNSGFERRLISVDARPRFEALAPTKSSKNTGIAGGFMNSTGNEQEDSPPDGYECTDWFIVITNHDTGEVVDEDYVGRTCQPIGGVQVDECLKKCSGAAMIKSAKLNQAQIVRNSSYAACGALGVEYGAQAASSGWLVALIFPGSPIAFGLIVGGVSFTACAVAAYKMHENEIKVINGQYLLDTAGCNCN